MAKYYFSTKDIVLMAVFGALSGVFIMTTIPLKAILPPGLPAIIFIPASTIFLLTARGLVGKFGAAAITGLIFGIVATILPGGPPLITLPKYILMGVIIDLFLLAVKKEVDSSKIISTITGAISYPILAVFLYFTLILVTPEKQLENMVNQIGGTYIQYIVILFLGLHTLLGAAGGFLAYYVLKRVKRAKI